LKHVKSLDKQTFSRAEKLALGGLLQNPENCAEDLGMKFKESLLTDGDLTVKYVSALRMQGKHELAESVASTALNKQWCEKLAEQYGLIDLKDPSVALNKAEKWAEKHKDDASLHLTLGRICKKAQLWGKAKAYFESSLSRKPLAETYSELASLHEQLNEHEEAHKCSKKGLAVAINRS